MLNFERTGLGSFLHTLQFWKAFVWVSSGKLRAKAQELGVRRENCERRRRNWGLGEKTASEGAGIGGNLKAQENVLFAMKKSFTFVASIMKK